MSEKRDDSIVILNELCELLSEKNKKYKKNNSKNREKLKLTRATLILFEMKIRLVVSKKVCLDNLPHLKKSASLLSFYFTILRIVVLYIMNWVDCFDYFLFFLSNEKTKLWYSGAFSFLFSRGERVGDICSGKLYRDFIYVIILHYLAIKTTTTTTFFSRFRTRKCSKYLEF